MIHNQIQSPVGFYAYLEGDNVVLRTHHGDRLIVGDCTTVGEHLAAPTKDGEDRRSCCFYIADLIPKEWLGKRGRVTIAIQFEEEP